MCRTRSHSHGERANKALAFVVRPALRSAAVQRLNLVRELNVQELNRLPRDLLFSLTFELARLLLIPTARGKAGVAMGTAHRIGSIGIALGFAAGLLVAREARAQSYCGSVSAGWNVPNGDPVFVSGPGPIYAVLSSVGEYRSHSMLSRGPDGWITHGTSITPPTNSDTSPYYTPFCSSCGSECWNPISPSFLTASKPGLETVQPGAIYNFLYGNGSTENFIAYQRGSGGGGSFSSANNQAAIGNLMLGNGMGWTGWWSGGSNVGNQQSGGQYTYVWENTYNGAGINYGWYQYMNVQGTPQGVPGVNTGVVCSSSLALWHHDALSGVSGYTGDIPARTYSGLSTAANALWNGVQSECSSTTGWFSSVGSFFTNLGWSALCVGVTGYTQGVCGQAADQMVNCFAANNCGNTSSPGAYFGNYNTKNNGNAQWEAVVNSGASAVGISPDDIACWNRPGNGTGAPCSGNGASIWGWDTNQTPQWNAGGTQYACWD